jgi:hypothetical protein
VLVSGFDEASVANTAERARQLANRGLAHLGE